MKSPDQKKVEAHKHISLFLACFSISSIIFKNSVAAESTTTFFDILFGREQTWADMVVYWLKRIFYVRSFNDLTKLVVRLIFSSFAKDGVLSIWMPKNYTNKVSPKLTQQIMGKAFDASWIPKTDKDRHDELRTGKPASQNIFYSQLRPVFNAVIFICSKTNLLLIAITELVNQISKFVITTGIGMISFTVRSGITAISLILLVPIHIGQTVLRVIRWFHNLTMSCLRTTSQVVNDVGMLNVDLIKESFVYEAGEQMQEIQKQQSFVRKSMMSLATPQQKFGSSLAPSTGGKSVDGLDRARNYSPSSDPTSE